MFQHYIFDVDGTLINSRAGVLRALQESLQGVGASYQLEHLEKIAFGPPLDEIFEAIIGDRDKCIQAEHIFRTLYDTVGIFESVVYEGIPTLLSGLHKAGKMVSFFSANNDIVITRLLDMHGLVQKDDLVKTSQTKNIKVAKVELLRQIVQERLISASEAIVIGDTDADFFAAEANGLRFIGAGYGYKGTDFLQNLGVREIAETPHLLASLLIA